MNTRFMRTPGLLTVCVASLSCGSLSVDYDHNRLNNGCAGELKVLINIWYKMNSKAQKAPLAIGGDGLVEGQRTETKSQS